MAPGQRDLAQGVGVFRAGGARPPLQEMKSFIDEHRVEHGVEPICKVLQIVPATYYAHAARQADPQRRSQRSKTDDVLMTHVERIWNENFGSTGCAGCGGSCDASGSTWRAVRSSD